MEEGSESVTSEDSGTADAVETNEMSSNFVMVPKMTGSGDVLDGLQNFHADIEKLLGEKETDPEAIKWILSNFYNWRSLEEINGCEHLPPGKIKVVELALTPFFEQFEETKREIGDMLQKVNIAEEITNSESLYEHLFCGSDSFRSFLAHKAEKYFSCEQMVKIRSAFEIQIEAEELPLDENGYREVSLKVERLRKVLEELNFDQEAFDEILEKLSTSMDLKSGLDSCQDLTKRQVRLLEEKLSHLYCPEPEQKTISDHVALFADLKLSPEAIEWIERWLKDADVSQLDLNELDKCEDLSKRQLKAVQEKLKELYGICPGPIIEPPKDPRKVFLEHVQSVLDSKPNIDETARKWVLENIESFESIEQLHSCDDLTKRQIEYLKTDLSEQFALYKPNILEVIAQPEAIEKVVTSQSPQPGSSKVIQVSAMYPESSIDELKSDTSRQMTITPLILFRTKYQEGCSVDDFVLSEEGVRYICSQVHDDMLGKTPVCYRSATDGTVIDFELLNKISIDCIGLFGPLTGVLSSLKQTLLDVELRSLEESLNKQCAGLYLVDKLETKKSFLIINSEADFADVRKDSKLVHLLRYMTQLTNFVVFCIDKKFQNRLATAEDAVVRGSRRSQYNLKQREVKQESVDVKELGKLGQEYKYDHIMSSEHGFIGVKFCKKDASNLKEPYFSFGTVGELKSAVDSMLYENADKVCGEFKFEYVQYFFKEKFSELERKVDTEISSKKEGIENSIREIVILSAIMHFTKFKKPSIASRVLQHYFTTNPDETNNFSQKWIPFNINSIVTPFGNDCVKELKKKFASESEEMQLIEKFLLWNALTEHKKMPSKILVKGCPGASWKEIKECAMDHFGRKFSWGSEETLRTKMEEQERKLLYFNASELLKTSINDYLDNAWSLIEPYTKETNFLVYCNQRLNRKLLREKDEMLFKGTRKIFDDFITEKMFDTNTAPTPTKKLSVVQSISTKKSCSADQEFSCRYELITMIRNKVEIKFTCLSLEKTDQQKLVFNAANLSSAKFQFIELPTALELLENEVLVTGYPLANDNVLIIFNTGETSKTKVYKMPNFDKAVLDMVFRNNIIASSFDSRTRVLALQSSAEPGAIRLFKLSEDYKTRESLKTVELHQILEIDSCVDFCLQPNSKFIWFFKNEKLYKFDYKSGALVGKSLKVEENQLKLTVTPDGSCLLASNLISQTYLIMTETCNVMTPIESCAEVAGIFSICGQTFIVKQSLTNLTIAQVSVSGAEHETKLNKQSTPKLNVKSSEETSEPHWINYLYWMYTKFPCKDMLANNQEKLQVWFCFEEQCNKNLANELQKEIILLQNKLEFTRKPLGFVQINYVKLFVSVAHIPFTQRNATLLGFFLKQLIKFVPIQIARTQSNMFFIWDNGKPVSLDSVRITLDLIDKIDFGYYQSIFNAWRGDIKVISSMGKQSTGKSYTLNHLTGSSFNIAGTRCTDGCWMTVKEQEDCLYVILDFEGLGSFERTEQEDMLLSLFNSSISTITIFKTEKQLDRDVDRTLNKINMGSDQLKGNGQIFMGKFMITINDVAEQDIEDVPREFEEKISKIVSRSDNNFIKRLYNGDFEIMAFPAFESADYYEHLENLLKIIKDEIKPVFSGGVEFTRIMKLLMAKLAINDFSPLDRQQIDERIRFLKSTLKYAIHFGQTDDLPRRPELELRSLDSPKFRMNHQKSILITEQLGYVTLNQNEITFENLLLDGLLLKFLNVAKPNHQNFNDWRNGLEKFVHECVLFRFENVKCWLEENLLKWKECNNAEYDDIIKTIMDSLEDKRINFVQTYKFCDEFCSKCRFKCSEILNHKGEHKCPTKHECTSDCELCESDCRTSCKFPFAHDGKHVCGEVNHFCGEPCRFKDVNECAGECQKLNGHDGHHTCPEKFHPCKKICSLEHCLGRCVINCEEEHNVHKCTKEQCIHPCSVDSCTNKCSSLDHFHGSKWSPSYKEERGVVGEAPFVLENGTSIYCNDHFCGKEHQCYHKCEKEGFCRVSTEKKQQKDKTFQGARGKFTYSLKFVEKGEKLKCRHRLPPFTKRHEGAHTCSTETHCCSAMCPTCENICNKVVNHELEGDTLHHTSHGNMRKCFFVANEDDIQVGTHKYKVGEPAIAEMCHIFCNSLGRGHSHVIECDSEKRHKCKYTAKRDNRRHQTTKYHPNPEIPKDEITHEAYWNSIGFQDPCQQNDVDEFQRCPAFCASSAHEKNGENGEDEKVYCEMGIWHDPIKHIEQAGRNEGIVTADGHVFPCSHPTGRYHFVLCLDDSGSMHGKPWEDLVHAVRNFVKQRKLISTVDMISVEIYNSVARIEAEYQPITSFTSAWLTYRTGQTDFSVALKTADEIISRHLSDSVIPVLIFMSDGGSYNGEVEMNNIAKKYRVSYNLKVYTLGFGKADFYKLRELARLGQGEHIDAVNGVDLKTAFVEISAKHPPTIGVAF